MRNGTALIGSGQLNRVVIGGGGFVTCIDCNPTTGRMIIGCDTSPAQWRDLAGGAGGGQWQDCLNAANTAGLGLPDNNGNTYASGATGACGVAIAPSNPAVMMVVMLGYILRTTDSWQTVTKCNLAPKTMDSNGGIPRFWNPRLAIHPTDPNTFVVGMQTGGAYYSTDGGATVTSTGIAAGPSNGGTPSNLVRFDPGAPANVYVSKNGTGVYRSTTGVAGTFSLVTGGSLSPSALEVAADGTLYACDNDTGLVWKLPRGSSTWAQTATQPPGGASTIASNPANSSYLITGHYASSHHSFSYDAGATWVHLDNMSVDATSNGLTWLETSSWFFTAQLKFNAYDGKIYRVHGTGVFRATPIASGSTNYTPWVWEDYSLGNEMLGVLGFYSQPGVETLVRVYDKAILRPHNLRSPDSRPIVPGITSAGGAVTHAFSIDHEPGNPQHLVALVNYGGWFNGYNNNGGAGFWSKFSQPAHPDAGYQQLYYHGQTANFSIGETITGGASGNSGVVMGQQDYGGTGFVFLQMPLTGTVDQFGRGFTQNETLTGSLGGSAVADWSSDYPSPLGGMICRTGPTQMIWCPGNGHRVVRSTDFGATWLDLTIGGITPVIQQNSSMWLNRWNLASDKEQPGHAVFIGRNEDHPTPHLPLAGVWFTSDHGATWTEKFDGLLESSVDSNQFWGCRMAYVPGHASKLIYSEGFTTINPLITSPDDGANWSRLGASYSVQGVWDFSFGKGLPGSSWPALFFLGTVNGTQGLWVTYDMFATVPVAVATGTNTWFWGYSAVGGDWNVLGRVWVALATGGLGYYDFKDVRALT